MRFLHVLRIEANAGMKVFRTTLKVIWIKINGIWEFNGFSWADIFL